LIIQRSIVSTDDNPLYYEFWPVVAKAWRNIGIQPLVAAIGGVTLDYFYGTVINIPSIEGISNGFIAQVIRFILPCFFPEDVSIIGDIDMIPLRRDYFTKQVAAYDEDSIVVFSADAYKGEIRYPMCYIAAKGKYFQEIIGLKSINSSDILAFIKELHSLNLNWDTDELYFSRRLHASPLLQNTIFIKRGGWNPFARNRVDRGAWHCSKINLCIDKYIDAHCLRPLDKHREQLKAIFKYVDLGNNGSVYLKYLLKGILRTPVNKMLLVKQRLGIGNIFHIRQTIPSYGESRNKIISFSLYGKSPRYTERLGETLDSYKRLYPDWKCRIYIAGDIFNDHKDFLTSHKCEVVVMKATGVDSAYMFWRFLAAADKNAEAMIVRDLDSMPTQREKAMVDEWIASGKKYHIIRDHIAHHARVMGGMWGVKCPGFDVIASTKGFLLTNNYALDQVFLEKFVYPEMSNSVMIHDRFPRFPEEKEVITIPLEPGEIYIGEVTTSDIYGVADRNELLQNGNVINLV